MSMPDWFLVAWWLLLPPVGIAMFFLGRRSNALGGQRAALAYMNKGWSGRYPAWQVPHVSLLVQVPLLLSLVYLVVGFIVLIIMNDWTRLWMLNFQVFMVLLGVGVAILGLSPKALVDPTTGSSQQAPFLLRAAFVLSGIGMIGYFGTVAIQDLALPRQVVEGHVDYAYKSGGYDFDSQYVVVINSQRYRATFETFKNIRPGQRARVEIGAGSGMIFASDAKARRAASRPVRN